MQQDTPPEDDATGPAPDAAPGPARPAAALRRRRALQVAVAGLVLLAVVAAGVAATGPGADDDAVETAGDDRPSVDDDRDRPTGADVADPEGTGQGGDGSGDGAGPGGRRRSGDRARDRRDKGEDTKDRGDRDRPDGPGGSPGTTAPPPAPRVVASPTTLAPFGLLAVGASTPCAAGTATVAVEVRAVGGTRDGLVVASLEAPVAADGTWSSPAVALGVVGGVPGVAWAATADAVEVRASCGGAAPAYAPAVVALAPVAAAPTFTATLDGSTVTAEVAGCPTLARLHLVVGDLPPADGPDLDADETRDLTPAGTAGTWSGTAPVGAFDPEQDGLWATATCLDRAEAQPVWRHLAVELDAP